MTVQAFTLANTHNTMGSRLITCFINSMDMAVTTILAHIHSSRRHR